MSFAGAHKLATYLMVGAAYLAIWVTGALPPVLAVLYLAGILASWFFDPPRTLPERMPRVGVALVIAGAVWAGAAYVFSGNLIAAGMRLLACLVVLKLMGRKSARDYRQVVLLAFLTLVGGSVFFAGASYALVFLAYVIAATWALILLYLRREIEVRVGLDQPATAHVIAARGVIGGRFFAASSLVSLSIFAFAIALFFTIPRVGVGLFYGSNDAQITFAGFHDGEKLGGHGRIRENPTVVMRVELAGITSARELPRLYWRGVAFDHYERGSWSRSDSAPASRIVDLRRHHRLFRFPLYGTEAWLSGDVRRRKADTLRQTIYLEPLGTDVLFGAAMPAAFVIGGSRARPGTAHNDEVHMIRDGALKYTVYSRINTPPPDLLRAAPTALPLAYRTAYLQLPPEIPDRVITLARDITKNATNNYDRALAISTWLSHNLDYTLEMVSPGDREPIDFFLFDRKRGHCEYFASAMTILARAVGVPARNVNGFVGGEWNEYDQYVAVRGGDAHSWVEVYFPGAGWVTFDPTPAGSLSRLAMRDNGFLAKLRRLADTLKLRWRKWVIAYDLDRQMSLFRRLSNTLSATASGASSPAKGAARWLGKHARALGGAGAVLVAVLLVAGFLARRRRRDQPRSPSRPRSPIAPIYRRAVARLGRRGHARAKTQTPREHAEALMAAGVPGAEALIELSELYYRAELGGEAVPIHRARELARILARAK